MMGYFGNLENEIISNINFREVLFTGKHSQLVAMSLAPNEDIGMEVHHDVDQFFRIEDGEGMLLIDGVEKTFGDDFAFVVPAGSEHNITNTSGSEPLKLYTIYSPANHPDGTVHATKADAVAAEEHE